MKTSSLFSLIAAAGLVLLTACTSPPETRRAPMLDVPAARLAPISVPGTRTFGASPEDLAVAGYVEQEYSVSGVANRYAFHDLMQDAAVIDGGHAYKTRIIVRRPANAARFNGTVIVEWFNVTLGQDIDFNWATSRGHLMREGYAYVGVSAQRVGVERLKTWSAARYGDLAVVAPETTPKDPLQAGDALRWDVSDVLSWDIFSQTVKALREPGAVDALPGMKPRRIIATGESQAGRRLTQYYNAIDPLHRLVDGMVFYDAGYNTWHLLRGDNPTRLIAVGSEVHSDGRKPVADGATTRRWEVAGTSHLSLWDMQVVDAMTTRDQGLKRRDGTPAATVQDLIPGCQHYPLWSAVPMHKVLNAAFDHVKRWVDGGPPPPAGKALERGADGAMLRHDENGRTFGGIQLAEYAQPTAFNLGYRNPGPVFCRNGGHHRFYSAAELKAIYPDPEAYVRRVVETTNANLAAGYILAVDAAETIKAAQDLFTQR
ncbi:alpha/beta hydrolase domain-containing protein [Aquabacterium sp.]|uniref:alpha/beta hydrolase domain-containing protein n=1 Tax=Aquabacterium sp. TaxID=1872578 RepID=UPI002CED9388|nr:alpha/beta hydrolase domain-containing protein [Aquabacterium sp.]HSW05633.1 alpha/beta hydrolase domain-containing protein [Aquabacterium sp.]